MPVSVEKVHHLVEYLDSVVPSSPPTLARLMVERDALLALLMWETSMRGKKCGGVTLSDFFQSDGQSLKLPLPSPLPIGSVDPQAQLDQNSERAQVRAFCPDSW